MARDVADKGILIVGGEPADRARLRAAFAPEYAVREARDAAEALAVPCDGSLAAVLIDLPAAEDRLALLEKFRGDEAFSRVPVLLLQEGGELGAADVIAKPFTPEIVRARVDSLARLMDAARRGEESRWRQELARASRVDPKTGLYNKATFCAEVSRLIGEEPDERWVIARWDIDRFKTFNDAYGTARGDQLLREIGRSFIESVPTGTARGMRLYGHWDADHFVSLWSGDAMDPERLYRYTAGALARVIPDYKFTIHFGLYQVTDPAIDVGVMCDRALLALKTVKGNYERHFAWYDASMRAELVDAQEITSDMQEALEKGQFIAYFQPQYDYEDGRLIGAEALARWLHPVKGLVSPARFIPVFEKNGFIFELDRCIWRTVCRSLRDWLDRGLNAPSVAVNISRRDLYYPQLVDTFQSLIAEYQLEPSMLRLEITESAYMEDAEQLISVVRQFRACGFRVEMDDFGSGFSSLNTLKDVPVDTLKMDMRFVSASENGGRGGSILSSVVRMAHALEMPVIAEGVETKQQADFLKSIGCLYMQGYLFAKPMPAEAFELLIRERAALPAPEERFRRGVDGAADFLDATTQSTLLFNSFVDGAGIIEYAGGNVAALRLNDKFFEVLGVSREEYGDKQYHILDRFSPETRAAYVQMLEDAIRTGEEASCESCSCPVAEDGEPIWVFNRVRFLSAKVDSCLFYLSVENITERKKLIDDNNELTERLSGIINSVPGGVQRFTLTPERFELVYFNDTTASMLGYTNEEFRALCAGDRLASVHPNERETLRRLLEDTLHGDVPDNGELKLRHICKDGSWRWLRMTGSVTLREPGRVSLSTIAMDISAEVAAEELFLSQQKELAAVISSVPGGIFKYAADGDDQFTYVSDTMLEMLGYTREEFTEKFNNRFSEMVYPEDRALALEKIDSDIAKTGSLDSCEYRIETKSGALKWVYDVGHLITDEAGRRWFIVVIVDIDERKRLERSLTELGQRAAALTENSPDGIICWRCDKDGVRADYVSDSLCALLHYSREELLATSCISDASLLHPDDAERILGAQRATLRTGERLDEQCRLRRKDGTYVWTMAHGSFVGDADGNGMFYGCVTDISELKAMEEKLASDKREIENLVNAIPGGVATYERRPDGFYLIYASDGVAALSGHTPEEYAAMIAEQKRPSVHPSDLEKVERAINKAIESGADMDVTYRVPHRDGRLIWINLRGRRMGQNNGHPLFYAVYHNLSVTTELYQRLLGEVWNALTVSDCKTHEILFANRAAYKLSGMTEEQAHKATCHEFLYHGDAPSEVCALEAAALPAQCEYEQDGRYYYARVSAIDWNGRDALVTSIADRTSLWQAKRQLETVLANIPAGIAVFHVEGDQVLRTYLSEGARQVLGYMQDEEPQLQMSGALPRTHPEDAPRVREATARSIANMELFNVDMRVMPRFGEPRWVNLTAKPVMEEGRLVFYGVYSDVAERRAIEESLRISEEEYRVAAGHGGRALYRYTVQDHVIHAAPEVARMFYDTPNVVNTPEVAVERGVIAPESVDSWRALFEAIDRGERSGSAEIRLHMTDGLYHWFDVRFTSVYFSDGSPFSAVLSYADITESRERSKSRAFEREGLYQALSTIYPTVMACNLTQNHYYMMKYDTFYNHTAKESGTFDALIDAGLSTVPEEDQEAFRRAFARESLLEAFAQGKRLVRLEHRQYDDKGALHWTETLVLRVDNPYDDDVLQISVARLIDEQKANEEKLERALSITSGKLAQRLYFGELASRSAPYLLTVFYCDGRPIPYVVGSLARQLGYDEDALLPVGVEGGRSIVYPPDEEALRQTRKRAIDAAAPDFEAEYRVVKADGDIAWILQRATRFVDQHGDAGYVNVLMDNTQQRALMDKLRMGEEETRFTMAQMGRMIAHYDVKTRTLNVPPQYALKHGIPEIIRDVPDSGVLDARFADQRTRDAYRAFYQALLRGEPSGKRDFKFVKADGNVCWEHLEFVSIFDADGTPARAIVAVEDATSKYEQEAENEKLRESERIMRLVATHSERVVCSYDLRRGLARAWGEDNCAACSFPYFCKCSVEQIIAQRAVLPESAEALRGFFRDIRAGHVSGEAKLHIAGEQGRKRWLDVKYSTLFDKAGKPISAVISSLDVTDRYERDLAYARYAQSIEENRDKALILFETDLTADLVENQGGHSAKPVVNAAGRSHTEVVQELLHTVFTDENRAAAAQFLSREHLLTLYADGQREVEDVWRVRFRDGQFHWAHTAIQFVADPYTGHIRAFARISDVTAETQARLDAQRLAERDGLTGLYNRVTLEGLIREYLSHGKDESCVFLLLDLDDLKQINDHFGHAQGDRALGSIAAMLRAHFRSDDLLGRIGGDEFVAFLPGVRGAASLNATLSALVRKLSTLPIGEGDERHLHCSIGCALGKRGRDTFDTLYKQADTALYHVKRNGKNDFAFYSPEMRLADYHYEGHQTLTLKREELYEPRELRLLLSAVSAFFPVVLSANITKNTCYLMEYRDFEVPTLDETTSFDQFVEVSSGAMHPDDRAGYRRAFARDRLIAAYGEGRNVPLLLPPGGAGRADSAAGAILCVLPERGRGYLSFRAAAGEGVAAGDGLERA